jgi:hypothetical protein
LATLTFVSFGGDKHGGLCVYGGAGSAVFTYGFSTTSAMLGGIAFPDQGSGTALRV